MPDSITLHHIVAGIAGIFTAVMSYVSLKDSVLRNPVIPILVGIISAVGVSRLSEGWTNTIILPYTVLPFAFLVMLIVMALRGNVRRHPFSTTRQRDVTDSRKDISKTDGQ